ncbi:MAG: MFS transporter [Candidatus Ranarchaeia archaeon]
MKRNILLISLIGLITGFNYGIFNVLLPLYLELLGFSYGLIGIIYSFTPFSNGLFMVLYGSYSDKVSRKNCLIGATTLNVISTAVIPFSTTAQVFMGARIFNGASDALRKSVIQPLAIESDEENAGNTLAFFSGSVFLSSGLGMILSGFFVAFFGYSLTFLFVASIVSLTVVFSLLIVEEKRGKRKEKIKIRELFDFSGLTKNAKVLFIALFLIGIGAGLVESYTLPLFFSSKGLPTIVVGIFLGVAWLFFAVGDLAFVKKSKEYSQTKIFFITSTIAAILIGLISFVIQIETILIIYVIYSIIYGLTIPPRLELLSKSIKSNTKGFDTNFIFLGINLGFAIGMLMSGALLDFIGFEILFFIEGILLLLSGIVVSKYFIEEK